LHYLITGHTGFKGSWLSKMLSLQGHEVSGISLDPEPRSLFANSNISSVFKRDLRIDIRDKIKIDKVMSELNPDVIIHLAAQPLVRESYENPIDTFETNVIGTLNVLSSSFRLSNLKATLIVTTDKVYKNKPVLGGYHEENELGGDDPYSASKAAADIATQSWIKSFSSTPITIARAGNVIGGGDYAKNRIIPDLAAALSQGKIPVLRYPGAIRPWQHVLDCLAGYLKAVDHMVLTQDSNIFNFGPSLDTLKSVEILANAFAEEWGIENFSFTVSKDQLKETDNLALDSSKARKILNWTDAYTFQRAVKDTVAMYKNPSNQNEIMKNQIEEYFKAFK
jgi:CDP-glucose 4,6-dehydratase